MKTTTPEPADSADSSLGVRHLVDFLVTLALWVILVRAFAVEGYIISTGSMAPHLLGYHKRVVCPSCGTTFAVGVRIDGRTKPPRWAVCPNCGQSGIDISNVPLNAGDQLLVHKHAYTFGEPRRWDVVVFRNPEKPTQAYVKRLVGFPGERVQIRDGDVYIDGRIARKDLLQQRATRILVYDVDHTPRPAPDWQPRWVPDDGWTRLRSRFVSRVRPAHGQQPPPYHWLSYRNWIRSGGNHWTAVVVRPWPSDAPRRCPDWPELDRVDLAPQAGLIRCRGVLSTQAERRLAALSRSQAWRRAVRQLAEKSHVAPVSDLYAYDDPSVQQAPNSVRDLMVECRVRVLGGNGRLVFRMLDGRHVYDCVLDWRAGQVRLFWDGENKAVAEHKLLVREEPFLFEMSTFDRQVLAAVDGQVLFRVPVPENRQPAADGGRVAFRDPRFALSRPVYIAVRGLSVELERLRLYRDIYYTAAHTQRATTRAYTLGPDEYFFLGDNSPVSLDSRSWNNPVVRRNMFLGKPLVLHLPSRPARIRIGHWESYIRIPDFSRIRYIR